MRRSLPPSTRSLAGPSGTALPGYRPWEVLRRFAKSRRSPARSRGVQNTHARSGSRVRLPVSTPGKADSPGRRCARHLSHAGANRSGFARITTSPNSSALVLRGLGRRPKSIVRQPLNRARFHRDSPENVAAADDSRSGKGRLLGGRAARNGWDWSSPRSRARATTLFFISRSSHSLVSRRARYRIGRKSLTHAPEASGSTVDVFTVR